MRIFPLTLTLGLLVTSTAEAADGRSFDLACRIDTVGTAPVPQFNRSGRVALKVRADLASNSFCVDACDDVQQLSDVRPEYIEGQIGEHRFRVQRASGKIQYERLGLYSAVGIGTCDTRPFSGFPKRGF